MRKGIVDRFEEDVAVVEVHGRQEHVPRAKLSSEAREGDVVDLDSGRVLVEETRKRREEAASENARGPSSSGDFEL